jgi:hypothetical protein
MKKMILIVSLLLLAFGFIPPASAEPDVVEYIVTTSEEVTDLGNGFYTGKCKYKFMVDGTRRATVKVKSKVRWHKNGVKIIWSNEVFRYDYDTGDGYFIWFDPFGNNWDEFPTGWQNYLMSMARYVYAYQIGWNFVLSVDENDEAVFDCWSFPFIP